MNTALYAEEPNAWDRQPDEPNRAFAWFCVYRDMGASRSIDLAFCQTRGLQMGSRRASSSFSRMATEHRWTLRSEAYDAHLERQARVGREDQYNADLESFRQRQKSLGRASLGCAVNLLNKANDALKVLEQEKITPSVISSMFRAAAAVALLASNLEASSLGVESLIRDMINQEDALIDA